MTTECITAISAEFDKALAGIEKSAVALFKLEVKASTARGKLAELAKAALAAGVPQSRIVETIKRAGEEHGATASTLSRALLDCGIRQRGERSDKGEEKAAKDPVKAEKAIKAILSGFSAEERIGMAQRVALWATSAAE